MRLALALALLVACAPPAHEGCPLGQGGGADCGSGVGIPAAPPTLAFGLLPVGQSKALSLTVLNVGTASLTFTGAQGPGAPFELMGGIPQTLAPGTTGEVALTFQPTDAGALDASLRLLTDSPEQPTLEVELTGSGE